MLKNTETSAEMVPASGTKKLSTENKNNERRTLTVFGAETEFDGVLEFSDDLIITGKFTGKINATGNLEIEKNAVCTVEKISANTILVSGTVTGDIAASRIRIENNVEFEGKITMLDSMPDTNLFAGASKEFKSAMVLRSDTIE